MVSLHSICDDVLMYAQALDNSGDTECWRDYARMESGAPEAAALRKVIDLVFSSGRKIYQGKHGSEYWLGKDGWSIIKAYPETLDCGGRESPVLIVFNGNSAKRKAVSVSEACRVLVLNRRIGPNKLAELEKMVLFVRLPLWVTYILASVFRMFRGLAK